MNKSLTSFCLDAFDKSISSPIGRAISFYYESLPFTPTDDINIFLFKKRLIDMNYYNSPESFLIDLQRVIGLASRFFGTESDISVALLSLQYSIQSLLQPVIELQKSTEIQRDTNENIEKDSKWKKSKNKLLDDLNNFLDKLPNNIDSFKKFTDPIENKQYVDNEEHVKYPNPDIKIDYLELKSKIERIDKDKNVYELMDIIEHHQPELSNTVGSVRLDLKLCHPHTLYLINEFVKKCKLRPLPEPVVTASIEKIQRSQSVPLRKSNSSSTIILQNPLHNKSIQQKQELQQQVQNQIQSQFQNQHQQQIQNQTNIQNQAGIQNQFQNQFQSNNPNFFTTNNINRQASLQTLNQHQLQLQLKNINSYNIKNTRNTVSFSHSSSSLNSSTSSAKSPTSSTVEMQDQSSGSPQSPSLMSLAPPQSCLISQKVSTSSPMMSNLSVQPSSMTSIPPQQSQSQQQQQQQLKPKRAYKPKNTKQPKQYKNQKNQKNQINNDTSNVQNNIQLQLQMQMHLQQQQQNQHKIDSETQQLSPFLQEAITIARMNNFINPETGNSPQIHQSTSLSAPPTPAASVESSFNTKSTLPESTVTNSLQQAAPPPENYQAAAQKLVANENLNNNVAPVTPSPEKIQEQNSFDQSEEEKMQQNQSQPTLEQMQSSQQEKQNQNEK